MYPYLPTSEMFPRSDSNFRNFEPLFTLLQVSPTYELARLYRSGNCSVELKNLLPNDFEKVLNTYDKFGSVMDIENYRWLKIIPRRYFGRQHVDPPLQTLGFIGIRNEDSFTTENLFSELDEFLATHKRLQDDSIYQVVAVNTKFGLPDLLEDFKFHMKRMRRYLPNKNEVVIAEEKAELQKERLHISKISKGAELLMEKVANPSLPNWRLGVRVKFSSTFDKRIKNQNLRLEEIKDAQVEYGKIIYRAIKKFERMAENAARGNYPCDHKIEYEKFDYPAIQKRMNSYFEWVRQNPIRYPDLPDLPEDATMDEFFERINTPPLPREKFEIDGRQKDLF
jgi:hypothetical protein